MDSVTGTTEFMNDTNIFFHCQSTENIGAFFLHIVMIIGLIVGLPANVLALWIFSFCMKFWKPHTLLLFNLALADVLLLIGVPFRIDSYLRGDYWVFGQVWCRINLFMLSVSRSASIAFLTAVALDRYFKVLHPHLCISRMTLTQAGWLAGLMWIVVLALRIPLLTTNLLYQNGNISLCRSFNSYNVTPLAIKVHHVTFIAEFFLPWFLLLFCSARIACYLYKRGMDRQKVRRAIRAVGVIFLVFSICFMPSILTGLSGMYIKHFHPGDSVSYNLFTQLFMVCIGFTYLNSALNPVIYSYSSSMFHDALKNLISHCRLVKKNIRPDSNTADNM